MKAHLRFLSLLAAVIAASLAARTLLAADDPKPAKNPSDALTAEEIRKLFEKLPSNVKRDLENSASSTMVLSYIARDDDSALANGRLLLMLDPEKAEELPQAEAIVAELHRRKVKGPFGKTPEEKLPAGFDSWPTPRKLTFLIEALDEVDNQNLPRTFFESLSGRDWRIEALTGIGDAAVPALIDTIEHDERLTRSLEPTFNRFNPSMKVRTVRDTAVAALLAILRVHCFDPTQEEAFSRFDGKENIQTIVKQLRAYWEANSDLPFDERMMKVLANPHASDEACREAAHNLTAAKEAYFPGPLGIEVHSPANPAPDSREALAKFQTPTVGEAILAVFDRVTADHEARARECREYPNGEHSGVEQAYLGPLADLHDKHLGPEFQRRYHAAQSLHKRMVWSIAANASGDSVPIKDLAEEFRDGKLIIPGHDLGEKVSIGEVGTSDLMDLIGCFTKIDLPETNQALVAAADPTHPLHDRIARKIAASRPGGGPPFDEPWSEHPFCLAFLRQSLEDNAPTGAIYQIKADSLDLTGPNFQSDGTVPEYLRDVSTRRENSPELVCDRATVMIDELVFGMPLVHPLRNDHDDRLKELIAMLDRYQGRFRRASSAERQILGWEIPFIADISTSGKSATAEDVKAGRAMFSLSVTSKPAPMELPKVGKFKQNPKDAQPEQVLVVQAEIDADGKTVYGVIGRRFMRAAKSDELTDVKPIEPADHLTTFRHAQ